MTIKRFFQYIKTKGLINFLKLCLAEFRVVLLEYTENSYSQLREDKIIDAALNFPLTGFYVDVGANNPDRFNNTKRFFNRGWSGINIDPNVKSIEKFNRSRPGEINLLMGINSSSSQATLYEFDPSFVSTFSVKEKTRNEEIGYRFLGVKKIPTETLNQVFLKYRPSGEIDILSVDAEGLDFAILKSNDWEKFHPKVICVESLENNVLTPEGQRILHYLQGQGYAEYSRTFSNLILVENDFSRQSFIKKITSTRVVITTHRSAPTHADEIKQFFINQKSKDVWFIGHEFAQISTRRTFVEHYEHGHLTSVVFSRDYKFIPELLIYLKDALFSVWYMLTRVKRADLYIGVSAFDTVPGILCKPWLHFKSLVFLTIDFVPKRFDNIFLNRIYIFLDKFCINHTNETWNPSPRMVEGREQVWGYGKAFRLKQRDFPFGIWLEDPSRPNQKSKTPLLIFSGHIIPKQGVQLAIQALPEIIKKVPDVELAVIGTGDYLSELRKMVNDLKLSSHVKFLGYIDSQTQSQLLKKAWIGLCTFDPKLDTFSYYSDPGKVKIYLGSGLPIIMTGVPYIAKIINQSKAGIVINYTQRDFVKAVATLLGDDKQLSVYSQNAWNLAKTFDWDKILTDHLKNLL